MLPNNPSPLGSRVSPKSERGARGCVGGGGVVVVVWWWCGGGGVVVWWWCGGGGGGAYYLLVLRTMLGRFLSGL